jgi:hypothetical protein
MDELTLANHVKIFVFCGTFALLCPVQVKALANKQVVKLLYDYIHALRTLKILDLSNHINQDPVR